MRPGRSLQWFRSFGLRVKLVLAFLSVAALVGLAGAAGLFFVHRSASQVAYLTDVVAPLRAESGDLIHNEQALRRALFNALNPYFDDRDGEHGPDRLAALQDALAASEQTGRERIERLRVLAARAGLDLPLDEALRAQESAAALMTRMIEHDGRKRLAMAGRQDRLLRFRDAWHRLVATLQDVAFAAEAELAKAEEQGKTEAQSGSASTASLSALLSESLTVIYPRLQGADRLTQAMVRLDELAMRHLAQAELATLGEIEAVARDVLGSGRVQLRRLAGRLQSSGEGDRIEQLRQALEEVEAMLLAPGGGFARHREALLRSTAFEADRLALRHIESNLAAVLARVEDAVRSLERQVSATAQRSAREAELGLSAVAILGTLLACGLGLFCAGRLIEPLSRLREAVAAMAEGRRPAAMPDLVRQDEIGAVAASVLERTAHLATHDALTGLPNRALFLDRLAQALAAAQREGSAVAVFCLDLDRFKEVNDTLGHVAGDKLLSQVALRLAGTLRECDTLARLGSDEFAIIQIDATQPTDAEVLVERLAAALAPPFDIDGQQAMIGASFGIALRTGTAVTVNPILLMQEADVALYRAKEEGGSAWRFFNAEMNERLQERKAMEADLRRALAEGELRLHYQPQVSSERGRQIIGAEALLRWHHAERGDVSPAVFIPLAEEVGLIGAIGEWVLRGACRQAAAWPALSHMAVNVSPIQFRQPEFLETVKAALRDSGLEPRRLELEITEGVLLHDTDETVALLNELHALGVSIAMDDFGTGYSSLGYLRKFHFDKIKIDRSFIQGLGEDRDAAAIVRAVVGISQALGMRTNAEGVEEEGQARLLHAEGCEEMQGFLFGRPMPPAAFEAMLLQSDVRAAE